MSTEGSARQLWVDAAQKLYFEDGCIAPATSELWLSPGELMTVLPGVDDTRCQVLLLLITWLERDQGLSMGLGGVNSSLPENQTDVSLKLVKSSG